jgi:hypothetical protein
MGSWSHQDDFQFPGILYNGSYDLIKERSWNIRVLQSQEYIEPLRHLDRPQIEKWLSAVWLDILYFTKAPNGWIFNSECVLLVDFGFATNRWVLWVGQLFQHEYLLVKKLRIQLSATTGSLEASTRSHLRGT